MRWFSCANVTLKAFVYLCCHFFDFAFSYWSGYWVKFLEAFWYVGQCEAEDLSFIVSVLIHFDSSVEEQKLLLIREKNFLSAYKRCNNYHIFLEVISSSFPRNNPVPYYNRSFLGYVKVQSSLRQNFLCL